LAAQSLLWFLHGCANPAGRANPPARVNCKIFVITGYSSTTEAEENAARIHSIRSRRQSSGVKGAEGLHAFHPGKEIGDWENRYQGLNFSCLRVAWTSLIG
jgi:hypothetical protein